MKRAMISGAGTVCSLGAGMDCFAASLKAGESGILEISDSALDGSHVYHAALIEEFEVDEYLPSPKNYLDRNSELAFAACRLALDDAGFDIRTEAFWQGGFDVIAKMIAELEELTKATA